MTAPSSSFVPLWYPPRPNGHISQYYDWKTIVRPHHNQPPLLAPPTPVPTPQALPLPSPSPSLGFHPTPWHPVLHPSPSHYVLHPYETRTRSTDGINPPFSWIRNDIPQSRPLDKETIEKIRHLNEKSPPFAAHRHTARYKVGLIIAVEGDNSAAIHNVFNTLSSYFQEHDFDVYKADWGGTPTQPGPVIVDGTILEEYQRVITAETRHIHKMMVPHITTYRPPAANAVRLKPKIGIIDAFQFFAVEAFAPIIPTADTSYKYQWRGLARMWRPCIGPDVTIYVKDCDELELIREQLVEWMQDIRCLVVRRDQRFPNGTDHAFTIEKLCREARKIAESGGGWAEERYRWPAVLADEITL